MINMRKGTPVLLEAPLQINMSQLADMLLKMSMESVASIST